MIFEFIICSVIGILIILTGLMIWKQQKIDLLHEYHYKNVKKKDIRAYTALMGKGLIIIGVGTILTGIIDLTLHTQMGWFCFIIGFIVGIAILSYAQRKYNGS